MVLLRIVCDTDTQRHGDAESRDTESKAEQSRGKFEADRQDAGRQASSQLASQPASQPASQSQKAALTVPCNLFAQVCVWADHCRQSSRAISCVQCGGACWGLERKPFGVVLEKYCALHASSSSDRGRFVRADRRDGDALPARKAGQTGRDTHARHTCSGNNAYVTCMQLCYSAERLTCSGPRSVSKCPRRSRTLNSIASRALISSIVTCTSTPEDTER